MEVGKTVPAVEEDARSEASEWEIRERAEREEERRAEVVALGMEVEELPLFLPTPPLHGGGGVGDGHEFPIFSLLCVSLVRFTLFPKDRPGQRAIGMLARRRPVWSAAGKWYL